MAPSANQRDRIFGSGSASHTQAVGGETFSSNEQMLSSSSRTRTLIPFKTVG